MGQVFIPTQQSIILTSLDRLVARNADGGLSPNASHIILLGEDAGENLGDIDNIIVLGNDSLDGGTSDATLTGSNIIGGQIFGALVNVTAPASGHSGPVSVMGFNDFPLLANRVGAVIAIGSNIGEDMQAAGSEVSASVLIGNDVLGNQRTLNANGGAGFSASVIIGDRAGRGAAALALAGAGVFIANSVIVGAEAVENCGFNLGVPGTTFSDNVVLGHRALRVACSAQNSALTDVVAIGDSCANNLVRCTNSVFIGADITGQPSTATATTSMTLVGYGILGGSAAGSSGNTVLGALASISGLGSRNTLIGEQANAAAQIPAGANNRFLVETSAGTLLYGICQAISPAGIVVGQSAAANRDIPGFNILKLIDGTITGVAPVGGGFFYSVAGIVHWVSAGNLDYNLTNGGSLGNFTVATLPLAPPQASRAFVTDAAAPLFAAAPVGGGAVYSPVYFDGAAWLCG